MLTLNLGTQKPILYTTVIEGNNVLLLDTPGFDDSTRDNLDVLIDIVSHLYTFAIRRAEIEVRGVIFLHDISETRIGGSQVKTLGILKALCGDDRMGHVIVGTTMWDQKGSKKFAREETREQKLCEKYWEGIHSTTRLQEDDESAAKQIILDLLALPAILLLVQEEMMQSPHTVENTTVGRLAVPDGYKEIEELKSQEKAREEAFKAEVQRLEAEFEKREEEIQKAAESQRKEAEEAEEEALRLERARLRQEEESQRNYEEAKSEYEEAKSKYKEAKSKYNEQLRMRAESKQEVGEVQRSKEAMDEKREREKKDHEDEQRRQRELEEKIKQKTEELEKKRVEMEEELSSLKEVLEKMTAPPDLAWYHRATNSVVTFFGFRPLFEKAVRKTEEFFKKTEDFIRNMATTASPAPQ